MARDRVAGGQSGRPRHGQAAEGAGLPLSGAGRAPVERAQSGAGGEETMSDALTRGTRIRSILGGSAGNLVEWYDWYAYAAFTAYFAPHFFPTGAAQQANAWAIFAVGFFMRPIGGWLMGIYGDRRGRKAGLT